MSFVSLTYLLFLPLVWIGYWAMPGRTLQNLVLALASAVFYGWIHPWFLILLYATCLLDWGAALAMERWPARKNLCLGLSLTGNLGLLAVFKYFDFFTTSVATALGAFGIQASLPALQLLLPVGISFYTFQSLSYTLDVWRGDQRARRSLLDLVLFVSLFPQLVAGPIERARDLLPQLEKPRSFQASSIASGLGLILAGAVQKIVVADTLGLYVDRVFALDAPAFPLVWTATSAFAVQILADFGGYTLIARGSARMLGIELCENFRSPYLACTPSEFWRSWHISFSSWIHEYLYLPLRGRSPSGLRRSLATYGSMLASGLWHGASWNFALWGLFHATMLVLHRAWQKLVPLRLPRALAWPLMFLVTLVGWLLFRERSLERIFSHLSQSPLAARWEDWTVAGALISISLTGGALLAITNSVPRWAIFLHNRLPSPLFATARGASWGLASFSSLPETPHGTSSTSASEDALKRSRPCLLVLLSLSACLLVVLAGLALLREEASNAPSIYLPERPEGKNRPLLIVGNSLLDSFANPQELGKALFKDDLAVDTLIARGGGRVHMAAMLHSAVTRGTLHPRVIVVYLPAPV